MAFSPEKQFGQVRYEAVLCVCESGGLSVKGYALLKKWHPLELGVRGYRYFRRELEQFQKHSKNNANDQQGHE